MIWGESTGFLRSRDRDLDLPGCALTLRTLSHRFKVSVSVRGREPLVIRNLITIRSWHVAVICIAILFSAHFSLIFACRPADASVDSTVPTSFVRQNFDGPHVSFEAGPSSESLTDSHRSDMIEESEDKFVVSLLCLVSAFFIPPCKRAKTRACLNVGNSCSRTVSLPLRC
jgi:hypothetical protein